MSDSNIEKQNSVVDTYKEHSQHLVYRTDCSECYKKAPVVEINQEGDIVLSERDIEELTLDKRMEEAEQAFKG